MRVVAIGMTVLTVLFAGLWAYGYIYISAMACAFSTNGSCSVQAPWTLSGEDLQFMLLIPGAIFVVLLGLTTWLWRSASVTRQS